MKAFWMNIVLIGCIGTVFAQTEVKLTASDAEAGDQFGGMVAIDGDTIVVGAHRDDDGATESGSAYVFTRTGDAWNEKAKLTASDAAGADNFGCSVAVSGDVVVVGAWGDDDAASRSGSAYVFTRTAGFWSEQVKLTASDASVFDEFGIWVSVDGDTAVIGAFLDDDGGQNSGSAYVFTGPPIPVELQSFFVQ